MAEKETDREVLLRKFFEFCFSHDVLGPCDDVATLAGLLKPDVREFLALYELLDGDLHTLLEGACLALVQTESDRAPSKWDIRDVGVALRIAVDYHHRLASEATEVELQAASEVNGGELGKSVPKLVALPYYRYLAGNKDAQVALCAALGVVPMEVADQRADAGSDQAKASGSGKASASGKVAKLVPVARSGSMTL